MADKTPPSASPSVEALFDRRIDFHPARKPHTALSSAAAADFRLETLNPTSDPRRDAVAAAADKARPGAIVRRSDGGGAEFYEHGLDPELNFRTTFRKIGAGLQNLGNTCFLNSVLQCLTYTEPFAAYLQSGKHKSSCHTAGFCALCALQNHVMAALQSTGKILSPKHLVQNLRCISRNFRSARQEDAHEYMVNLLESMHKCCLPSGVPSESPSAYEKSLVHKIFGGHLRSQVKCTKCGYCSNKTDPFLDLSLEIHKADSLLKALRHFTAVEQLDGGERQYQCDRCKEKVRALKQLTVHKAPYVLTVHLKRFDSHIPGQKIDRKVEFEPTLDLKPFVSSSNANDLKYTLYGVLVHAGWSTHSGHYYCYVRTSTGLWHSLDDNQVRQVSEKTVLSQKAYMLFYVRDRATSVKRPADTIKKENICVNAPGNKQISSSISGSNKNVQSILMERKVSNMEPSFPKTGTIPSTCHKFDPGLKSKDILSNGRSLAETNALSLGLQQASSSTVSSSAQSMLTTDKHIQLDKKDSCQPATGNIAVTMGSGNSTTTVPQLNESNAKSSLAPYDCNEGTKLDIITTQSVNDGSNLKVKSDILTAQHSSFSGPSTKCEDKNDKHKESHKQQVGAVTSKNLRSSSPCGKQGKIKLAESGDFTVQNEVPDAINEQLETQHEIKNLSSCLPRENGLNDKETVKVTKPTEAGLLDEMQANIGVSPKDQKRKKPKCLLKGFGRNKLLMAVRKHKFKKSRSKKHHLRSNKLLDNAVSADVSVCGEGASTSEAVNGVCVINQNSSSRKRHYSSLEDNKNHIVKHKDLNSIDKSLEVITGNNSNGLVTCEQQNQCLGLSTSQCKSIRKDETGTGLTRHGITNLLISGLKETTVARWDDLELPNGKLNGSRYSNIGYVLDEWDEEYDRGKRKKVKKLKEAFDGPNPFQESANVKAQQKLKLLRGHLNQPFRI